MYQKKKKKKNLTKRIILVEPRCNLARKTI